MSKQLSILLASIKQKEVLASTRKTVSEILSKG